MAIDGWSPAHLFPSTANPLQILRDGCAWLLTPPTAHARDIDEVRVEVDIASLHHEVFVRMSAQLLRGPRILRAGKPLAPRRIEVPPMWMAWLIIFTVFVTALISIAVSHRP